METNQNPIVQFSDKRLPGYTLAVQANDDIQKLDIWTVSVPANGIPFTIKGHQRRDEDMVQCATRHALHMAEMMGDTRALLHTGRLAPRSNILTRFCDALEAHLGKLVLFGALASVITYFWI